MKDKYSFIVYADIHYDRKAARCVTVDDCSSVEEALHKRAVEGEFDFTLFCGDRFLRREPEDEIKTIADRTLIKGVCFRSSCPHFHLIGNHDWVGNSRKWHTSESLRDLPNIHIMDTPKTYGFNGVLIHALPAGFQFDYSQFEVDKEKLNIFVFHDMAIGAKTEAGHVFTEGVSLGDIDLSDFSLVFAGDIHLPQKFNFTNTIGGYAGSVLQRTMADALSPRGWWEVEATRSFSGWDIDLGFVPTRNLFSRYEFEVSENTRYEDCVIDETYLTDCMVNIVLNGNKANVDRVADDLRWANYREYYNVRGIEISRNYVLEKSEKIINMDKSNSLVDDVKVYLESGFSSTGNIDQNRILSVVEKLK